MGPPGEQFSAAQPEQTCRCTKNRVTHCKSTFCFFFYQITASCCGFQVFTHISLPSQLASHPTPSSPPRVKVAAWFLYMHKCCGQNKTEYSKHTQLGCETCMAHPASHRLQANIGKRNVGATNKQTSPTLVPCQPAHSAKSRGIHPTLQCICKAV